MDRLGLGYEALSALNPRLIYCAISGFGQTGPDALKPAYDQIIQGLSGEMALNGDERLNPLRCGFPVCDTVGGLNAAFALMAALYDRERTGEGQCIDVALLDSIMPLMGWVAANLLIGGQDPAVMGNDNFTAAPSGTFRTQDGFINIAANKQEQWEAVCDTLGVPGLKADPRFQERDTRKRNRKALTPLLEAELVQRPTAHWVDALNASDVPSGAILGLGDSAAPAPGAPPRACCSAPRSRAWARWKCSGSPPCSRNAPATWRPRRPPWASTTKRSTRGSALARPISPQLKAKGVI